MRRTILWLMLVCDMTSVHAQVPGREASLPAVSQILEMSAAALGGEAAARKLTSVHMTGSLEVTNMGATGSVEVYAKAPNKRFVRWVLPGTGTIRNGFNGKAGWSESLLGGIVQVEGQNLESMKRRSDLLQVFRLKELYSQWTLQGSQRTGDRECWVLLADAPDGRQEKWYFEAPSGLLRRVDCHAEDGLPLETDLEDYREVDGVRFPFSVRQFTPVYNIVMRFQSIRTNVPVDDRLFEKR